MKYVNQKNEIKGGQDYCGAACVAMVTEEKPQFVADIIGPSAADETLVKYLKKHGATVKQITDGGTKETKWAYRPNIVDFNAIKRAIDNGCIVLYHFAGWDKKSSGHYAVVIEYLDDAFIFMDPAGDRNAKYFGKTDEGSGAVYDNEMLAKAGIKRLWSIQL